MIIYNQAFDLYHSIHRMLLFLSEFEEGTIIEVSRIRIWDFYYLFPDKIHSIKLKRDEKEIRKFRKLIKKENNPYEYFPHDKKVFEKLKRYQLAALNCIASYGIIDKKSLTQNRVSIISKDILTQYISALEGLSEKEKNIITLLSSFFKQTSLFGKYGLKARTQLMESRYDT